ncbi:MAG: hypothetical protein KDK24_11750 [Pseudooceanicola sp.]|nr:hypothetical protein [Pseudooceanicola sp.]
MKHVAGALAVGLTVLAAAGETRAQALSPAMGEARSRMVCGSATLVSSQYIGGGMMRVTCRQQDQQDRQRRTQQQTQNPLQAGLTAPVAAGIAVTVLVIAAVTGGDKKAVASTSSSGSLSASR